MPKALQIEIGTSPIAFRLINPGVIENAVRNVLDALGIDLNVAVMVAAKKDLLTINQTVCHFPDPLLWEVEKYVAYLQKINGLGPEDDQFWNLLTTQIIWLHSHLLFPEEILTDYFPTLNTLVGDRSETHRLCLEIIQELLQLKISLKNKTIINEISAEFLNQTPIQWNDFREALIESLVSPEITIFIHPDYFDQIIITGSSDNLFELMRDGLFYETGVKYPPFTIVMDDQLPPKAFCFKINSFTTIPCVGLSYPDEILVNDTPDKMKTLVSEAKEAVNPANGNLSSIIRGEDREKVEKAGYTTWDSFGYFILAFSGTLRRYGYACINQKLTTQYLDTLNLIYPRMVELIRNGQLESICTHVLRLLAKEEISIRNMRVILEGILECDFIPIDSSQYIVFDERIPAPTETTVEWRNQAENVTEFVRTRLKKYISHKYTRGQSTLIVYLLDPEIEKIVDSFPDQVQKISSENISRIYEAVAVEFGNLPPSNQVPVILTTVTVRSPIKKIIEARYPQVTVLSYQELSPEMNIQPIAKISLS